MNFFKSPGIVVIGIEENNLEFGYFYKKKENFFELRSYKSQNLNKFEIVDSVVLNPILVQSYIQDFCVENKIYKPHLYLYLSDSSKIKNFIVTSKDQNSSRQELNIDEDGAFIWKFDCLGYDGDLYFYYVAGLAQELLFQYKLLISSLPYLLIKITTKNLALLNANKLSGVDILDLKNIKVEDLSNNLILPKIENFILSNDIKMSENFLVTCLGMLI